MDALLSTTQFVPGQYPFWDFQVVNNKVPIIYSTEEEMQRANVAAYTQKGLVPQARSIGVNWTGLLTGTATPSSIDTEIAIALTASNLPYMPKYKIVGTKLVVNIVHQ